MRERTPHVPGVEEGLKPLGSVSIPLAWEIVLEEIRRLIQQGAYLPGEHLPPERRLAEDLGVSRVTVREALRVLYGEGLVEKTARSSTLGGPLVRALPSPSEEEIRQELQQRLPHFLEILDCRMALESFAASQAAQKRTSEHLKLLDESMKEMVEASEAAKSAESSEASQPGEEGLQAKKVKQAARFRRAASVFHRTITAAAGNTKLLAILEDLQTESFTKVTVEVLYGDLQDEIRLREAMSEHQEILEAIRQEKESRAEEAMRRHINSTKQALVERSEKQF